MSGSKLDQIVKGAPPPGTSVPTVVSRSPSPAPQSSSENPIPTSSQVPDLFASLPSSPPQIYLNLLILEASLRSQYLTLRARRRQHTFFLLLLALWITGFLYALFLRPREDGSGVGGSVYWVIETGEKVALMGGIVTGVLLWGTGQWDRGVRWPRRWVGVANRGLRNINAKIVVIKGPWWKETLGFLSFLFPYSSFFWSQETSYHYVEPLEKHRRSEIKAQKVKEDLSPGGDYIKLLLLPKPFSPDFRENWELYRLEYWEKENERRSQLRRQFAQRQKRLAQEEGKWLWWTGWRLPSSPRAAAGHEADVERNSLIAPDKESKRRRSFSQMQPQSRNNSRSSTPASVDGEEASIPGHIRCGSNNHGNDRRRKLRSSGPTDTVTMSKRTTIESQQSS